MVLVRFDAHLVQVIVWRLQIPNFALQEQCAATQDQNVVAHGFDVRQEMAGKEQTHPLVVRQIATQFENFVAPRGVHAIGRLVQDQKTRIMHDPGGKLEALLHARRIGLDPAVPGFAQADIIQHLVCPLHGIAGWHPRQFTGVGDEADSLQARE